MSDSGEAQSLSGPHKVAAFLLSLEKEDGARVMRHLNPAVVPAVAAAMTELDPGLCTPDAIRELMDDMARTAFGRGVRPQDDYELHDILKSSFGAEEAERVISGIHARRRTEQPFAFIERANPAVVARLLLEESPAVVAVVLSHISPSVSAEVLGAFDDAHALEVVKRMTSISPPATATLLDLAEDLAERLTMAAAQPPPPDLQESLKSIAELLTFSGPDIEKAVLEGLEEQSEQLADQVREFMFTWEDLATIEKRAMQKILATVDTHTLSMSLKASSTAVEQSILGNLSKRVREMVADERELIGAVPLSDVLVARNEIMTAVRGLMEAGEFSPARAGEDLVT